MENFKNSLPIEGGVDSPEINEASSFFINQVKKLIDLLQKIENDPTGVAIISGLTALVSSVAMTMSEPGDWKMKAFKMVAIMGGSLTLIAAAKAVLDKKMG